MGKEELMFRLKRTREIIRRQSRWMSPLVATQRTFPVEVRGRLIAWLFSLWLLYLSCFFAIL